MPCSRGVPGEWGPATTPRLNLARHVGDDDGSSSATGSSSPPRSVSRWCSWIRSIPRTSMCCPRPGPVARGHRRCTGDTSSRCGAARSWSRTACRCCCPTSQAARHRRRPCRPSRSARRRAPEHPRGDGRAGSGVPRRSTASIGPVDLRALLRGPGARCARTPRSLCPPRGRVTRWGNPCARPACGRPQRADRRRHPRGGETLRITPAPSSARSSSPTSAGVPHRPARRGHPPPLTAAAQARHRRWHGARHGWRHADGLPGQRKPLRYFRGTGLPRTPRASPEPRSA